MAPPLLRAAVVALVAGWSLPACVSAFVAAPCVRSASSTTNRCAPLAAAAAARQQKSGPNRDGASSFSFSPRLVESLDLAPLFEIVARHAATRRGKDAILRLVHLADDDTNSGGVGGGGGVSRREAALAATTSDTYYSITRNAPIPPPKTAILSIAQSAEEANDEYELVRQATRALTAHRAPNSKGVASGSGDRDDTFILPPIYGDDTSPWDTGAPVTTDDDEWLALTLAGYAASMDKEHILQADKVVDRLLAVRAWAALNSTIAAAPGLSGIGMTISLEELKVLHNEIGNTVDVVRRRTISDPSGKKSFTFRLSGDKFPALKLLREREDKLLAELDNSMQQLFRNKSFASKVRSAPGEERRQRSEAFDFDGRLVVSAPKRIASDMGVIRGYSKTDGTCYVEPTSIVRKGDELSDIQDEIAVVENQIMHHQITAIAQAAPFIERAMDAMARIDSIFARAAFGSTLNGIIPSVKEEGIVHVENFVHPILALDPKAAGGSIVPIDLSLSKGCSSLIISGPNGGGKTLALKSFGVAAAMNKVGVPIPTDGPGLTSSNHDGHGESRSTRVDFFNSILVEVGDQQNLLGGESTLMARLNHISAVIQGITKSTHDEDAIEFTDKKMYPLILLDELGGGTDPNAGSAIARAVLEKMMESSEGAARIVATTHSPQLKALSIQDERFNCASVLLEGQQHDNLSSASESGFKRPTFRLQYGIIGDSYALGAASRCEPSLPEDVIRRAAELMTGGGDEQGNGDIFRAMTLSLEREQDAAKAATRKAEALTEEVMKCRGATVSLARAYADHLSRLENRLDSIYGTLKSDGSRSAYDIVGDTLGELRHIKRKVLTEEEILAERGLRMVSANHEFTEGESVVVVAEGEWDGQSATVTISGDLGSNEVAVIPSREWGWVSSDPNGADSSHEVIVLKRSDVALWDYPDQVDWGAVNDMSRTKSVSHSRQNLFDTLSKLTPPQDGSSKKGNDATTSPSENRSVSSKFTSSRERKAANATAKKQDKGRAKKKSKKRGRA